MPISEAQRQRIIRELGCCVPACRGQPIHLHHVRSAATAGVAHKPADAWLVPLCGTHHRYGHQTGWASFEARYGIDLAAIARELAQIDRPMP